MADYYTLSGTRLSGIADAIRSKSGTTAKIKPEEMAAAIAQIPTGGGGGEVYTTTAKLSTTGLSISFSGVAKQPKAWAVIATTQFSPSTTRTITHVAWDGSNYYGMYSYRYSGSGTMYYVTGYSASYANGVLTVASASASSYGSFNSSITYRLIAFM